MYSNMLCRFQTCLNRRICKIFFGNGMVRSFNIPKYLSLSSVRKCIRFNIHIRDLKQILKQIQNVHCLLCAVTQTTLLKMQVESNIQSTLTLFWNSLLTVAGVISMLITCLYTWANALQITFTLIRQHITLNLIASKYYLLLQI